MKQVEQFLYMRFVLFFNFFYFTLYLFLFLFAKQTTTLLPSTSKI